MLGEQTITQPSEEVYIAGALFNPEENEHNSKLAKLFRKAGYTVFNPLADGINGADETKEEDALLLEIHEADCEKIRGGKIFVANLNGPQVEDGTAYECAIASESQRLKKEGILTEGVDLMIGYFNDDRVLTRNMRRNPMPLGPFLKAPNIVLATRKEIVKYAVQNRPPRNA